MLMPVYTYRREDGSTFDIRQRFLDSPLEACPTTGQAVSRVIQPAGIIFKGSGFYVNDNNKAKNPAKPSGENGAGKPAKDGEKPAEKTTSKSESKPAKQEKTPASK
jgi:putative FmdB family regulatory protein